MSSGGGRLTKRLKDLCETGFIAEYTPWGKSQGEYYKIIDEFCLFYLKWCRIRKGQKFTFQHWIQISQRPEYYAWAGYAFEAVVQKHIDEILRALKISNACSYGSWQFQAKNKDEVGAQIDLIIDRMDNSINLCEIKNTQRPFQIDKQYAAKIKKNVELFKEKTKTTKQIFWSFIPFTH